MEESTSPDDLKDQLQQLCENFVAGGTDQCPVEAEEAAKEFVIDYLALTRKVHDPDPDQRDAIWKSAVELMKSWDPDDASVTYAAKLMRLLSVALDGRTVLFMESLEAHKANEDRQKQSERGNVPKKQDRLTKFIAEAKARKPDLTLKELWTKMEYASGDSLICSIDSESVEYYTGDGPHTKIVSKQAVASRLSRVKIIV